MCLLWLSRSYLYNSCSFVTVLKECILNDLGFDQFEIDNVKPNKIDAQLIWSWVV